MIRDLTEEEKQLIHLIRNSSREQLDELRKVMDDEVCLQILQRIQSNKVE